LLDLGGAGFAANVAAGGEKMLQLAIAFADGDANEQVSQPFLVGDVPLAFGTAAAEAAEDRLQHVLGINLLAQASIEPAPRQDNEASGIALKQQGGVFSTEDVVEVGLRAVSSHFWGYPRPTAKRNQRP
jgi:hypothetical protein